MIPDIILENYYTTGSLPKSNNSIYTSNEQNLDIEIEASHFTV